MGALLPNSRTNSLVHAGESHEPSRKLMTERIVAESEIVGNVLTATVKFETSTVARACCAEGRQFPHISFWLGTVC
jgi:hypothetical protein